VIGLDHFALRDDALATALREGRWHRYFQGYTTDAALALIGLGASAIGACRKGYGAPREPASDGCGVEISDEDRLRRSLIERLMRDLAVDLDGAAGRFASEL
jgi:oxygen-independent coproporphyrinogen III oxidase